MAWLVGYRRLEVMKLLAEGELPQKEIADIYGVSQQAISRLMVDYRTEIMDMRNRASDEFAGLWIAQKKNRLAELEDNARILRDAIQENEKKPEFQMLMPQFIKTHTAVLRSVADELGSIPSRIVVQQEPAKVQIEIISDELELEPKKPEDETSNQP